jgi:NAD-dependent SIR2 family protein deacetylase
MYEQSGVLEKHIIKFRGGYENQCSTCNHMFEVNEDKIKWRLGLPQSNSYLRGQFWTVQCRPCVIKTKEQWTESLARL